MKAKFGRAFTLVELVVAMAVFMITGALIFELLRLGTDLYARNLSVNISHQQARAALDRMVKDINDSVSTPTLVDTSLQPVTDPYAWAPGLTFLRQASPMLQVKSDAAGGQNVIRITTGSFVPKVGQRLVIPTYQIEQNITSVATIGGNNHELTLAANLGADVIVARSGSNVNIVAFVADVVSYAVIDSELRYFPNPVSPSYSVIAHNMTNPTPFGIPPNY